MTLTRHDLALKVAEELGLTSGESRRLVDRLFCQISDALCDGEEVMLSNFGKFALNDTPERIGRNPKTGVPVPIPARKRLSFKPAPKLTSKLNQKK
ncbi:HU family DNA-binding protein [Labrenzia sp. DG1229]|uniref:HU family DNA-binding protein n=1 Tax=Labrenzia sp. DG1229 TaxID=681847 RepID=UPI00048EF0E5|nr:HU family DNA-binding protein [Labrenzia sp. DG1229]